MIQLVLLGVIVGLLLAHLWRRPLRGVEGFADSRTPAPMSDSPDSMDAAGPAGLQPAPAGDEDDPRDLPWIASWSPLDTEARRGQNCTVHQEEPGPDGTVIQYVSKSCESGMAHTRDGDRIVIPDSIPEALRHETIEHERIHISQRRHPEAWMNFYQRNWGFVFHAGPPTEMPRAIVDARRGNPDTWDPDTGGPWPCWNGRWWPVPVYQSPRNPKLRNASTVWFDGWRREVREFPPEAWTQFFGTPSQNEHPHELAAVMIVGEDTVSEAGRRLWSWWRNNKSYMLAKA